MTANHPGQHGAVVVTGASSGIGEACALRLDRLGCRVFATVLPGEDSQALRGQASERLRVLPLDLADQASIAAATDSVAQELGSAGLAGLVNNAGTNVGGGPLEFIPLEAIRRQLEINVVGQIALTQALLPLLRRGRGRIVMMSSVAGGIVYPFVAPYAASKSALNALTAALRVELAPWGIPVSLVLPGVIRTPIWRKSVQGLNQMLSALPPPAQTLYAPSLEATRKFRARMSQRGSQVDVVAKAVAHALTASRPKTRYVVGRHAWLMELGARSPLFGNLVDRLVLREMRLPKRAP